MRSRRIPRFLLVMAAVAVVLGLTFTLPATAQAKKKRSYSIPRVEIRAQVQPDGTLLVQEERTYKFKGSFNGVYWDISTEGAEIDGEHGTRAIEVLDVGIARNPETPFSGKIVHFKQDTLSVDSDTYGQNGTYTMGEVAKKNTLCKRIKLFIQNC